jgi:hypothetical protein
VVVVWWWWFGGLVVFGGGGGGGVWCVARPPRPPVPAVVLKAGPCYRSGYQQRMIDSASTSALP